MRYYYKSKQGRGFLNLKTPLSEEEAKNYDELTEEQFIEAKKRPEKTNEQKAQAEKTRQINACKKYLQDTDYVVLKISEALAENNNEEVESIKSAYASELLQRKQARERINLLEAEV